jgi:hypothetical protein
LEWSVIFQKKYEEKDYEGKNTDELFKMLEKLPDEMFDVESSSSEFEELELAVDCFNYSKRPHSGSTFAERPIDYEGYTEKGKNKIDECIKWFKKNKSKTPVQDAWIKVLKKNGIKKKLKVYDRWCELPVMNKIDYSSKEELKVRRKKEQEEFKKKITPAQREEFKKLAGQLKNK